MKITILITLFAALIIVHFMMYGFKAFVFGNDIHIYTKNKGNFYGGVLSRFKRGGSAFMVLFLFLCSCGSSNKTTNNKISRESLKKNSRCCDENIVIDSVYNENISLDSVYNRYVIPISLFPLRLPKDSL